MVVLTMLECRCGRRYQIYVPKQFLIDQLLPGEDLDELAIDDDAEAFSQAELARSMADELGYLPFIDLREQQMIICECGWITDPMAGIRQVRRRNV